MGVALGGVRTGATAADAAWALGSVIWTVPCCVADPM